MKLKNILSIKKRHHFTLILFFTVSLLSAQEQESSINNFIFDCCETEEFRPNQPGAWAAFLPDSPEFDIFPGDAFSITAVISDSEEKREACNSQTPWDWEEIDGEGPYKVRFQSFDSENGYFIENGMQVEEFEIILEGDDIITGISQYSANVEIASDWQGLAVIFNINIDDLAPDIEFPNFGNLDDGDGTVSMTACNSPIACPSEIITTTVIPTDWNNSPYSITLGVDSPDNFEGLLITESFSDAVAGFIMDDLNANWLDDTNMELTSNGFPPLITPNEVASYLFAPNVLSVSGSFVVDENNEFIDNYSISYAEDNPFDIEKLEAFNFPPPPTPPDPEFKVNYSKTQFYSCSGNIIRSHTLNYRYNYLGAVEIRITP